MNKRDTRKLASQLFEISISIRNGGDLSVQADALLEIVSNLDPTLTHNSQQSGSSVSVKYAYRNYANDSFFFDRRILPVQFYFHGVKISAIAHDLTFVVNMSGEKMPCCADDRLFKRP